MADENAFVAHRLRSKPIAYTVRIEHFVEAGQWMTSYSIHDVAGDMENRNRIAADLRKFADRLDDAANEAILK